MSPGRISAGVVAPPVVQPVDMSPVRDGGVDLDLVN